MASPKNSGGEKMPIDHYFNELLPAQQRSPNPLPENGELQRFKKDREDLVNTEMEQSWDADAKRTATKNEERAAIIVRGLREFERRKVFGNIASEIVPSPNTRDMGGQFLTNKAMIENKSLLFMDIAKEVPKGALLHLHFNAELNPELLLEQARDMANMFVWSNRPLLEPEDLEETEMMFKIMPANTKSNNIFSEEFKTESDSWKKPESNDKVWMKWSEFMSIFRGKFGDEFEERHSEQDPLNSAQKPIELQPAENWILQKMVLSEAEAYSPKQTVNGYSTPLLISFPFILL